jgi:hypothetical protein
MRSAGPSAEIFLPASQRPIVQTQRYLEFGSDSDQLGQWKNSFIETALDVSSLVLDKGTKVKARLWILYAKVKTRSK